jgi:AAA+ superfamily predicted ATPase
VTTDDLFGQVALFPDPDAQERYAALIGIDDIKRRVVAQCTLLLDPSELVGWSNKHYGKLTRAAVEVMQRTPLVVFAGDVGTGKTELAESFSDQVARSKGIQITLYPLSLSARGKGAVGEMTSLITAAFKEVRQAASTSRNGDGRVVHGVVLLVDEADALAQSRELEQMHHEDRAGVNALIRGIDQLRNERMPVLTVLCTNRLEALDPAITRRASAIYKFDRPGEDQRSALFRVLLEDISVSSGDFTEIVELTGPSGGRFYGCTYSDIRQRLIPEAVMEALASDVKLTGNALIQIARDFEPTRPFGSVQ